MENKEKTRIMKNGTFIFPQDWKELNPKEAEEKTKIVFLVEGKKCGVYYSNCEARYLSDEEEKSLRLSGKKPGFSSNAHIYGYIEEVKNVGNARLVGGGRND